MERSEDHDTSAVFKVIFSWICFNFENSCIHSDWKSPSLFWGDNANVSISGRISEIIHCEQTRLDNFYVFLWEAVRKMLAKIGISDQPGKATPFPPIGTPKTVLKINCLFSRLFQPRLFYQSIPNCRLFLRAPILSDQVLHLQRISLHIGFNSAIYVP